MPTMARPNSFEYSELLPSEKVEGDERRSIETLREELHPRLKSTRRRAHTTIWASLAVGAFALCCLSMFFLGLRWQLNADRMCMERQSIYSPMWEDVYPSYTPVRFNGTLDAPSKFRGPPSPEVDRAWMRLKDGRAMILPVRKSISHADLNSGLSPPR